MLGDRTTREQRLRPKFNEITGERETKIEIIINAVLFIIMMGIFALMMVGVQGL